MQSWFSTCHNREAAKICLTFPICCLGTTCSFTVFLVCVYFLFVIACAYFLFVTTCLIMWKQVEHYT